MSGIGIGIAVYSSAFKVEDGLCVGVVSFVTELANKTRFGSGLDDRCAGAIPAAARAKLYATKVRVGRRRFHTRRSRERLVLRNCLKLALRSFVALVPF